MSKRPRLGKRERAAKRAAFQYREELVRAYRETLPKRVAGVPYRILSGSPMALSSKSPRFHDPSNIKRPDRPWQVPDRFKPKG